MHIFLLKLHIGRVITAHVINRIMVAHPCQVGLGHVLGHVLAAIAACDR